MSYILQKWYTTFAMTKLKLKLEKFQVSNDTPYYYILSKFYVSSNYL